MNYKDEISQWYQNHNFLTPQELEIQENISQIPIEIISKQTSDCSECNLDRKIQICCS